MITSIFLAALAAATGLERDIPYANGQKLDAWTPSGKGPFPAVIIVHGGGWEAGDKAHEWIRPLFAPIEQAGFAWFSIDYRLAPAHPWPACLDDTKAAVRWIKANARRFNVDPNRIAILGESSGGHLVNWIGVDPDPALRVRAVVSFYGLSDFVSRYKAQNSVLAKNVRQLIHIGVEAPVDDQVLAKLREISPIHHVRRGMPPFLFIHGTEDRGVPLEQSTVFCDQIRRVGSSCEVLSVPGAGHGVSNWEKQPELHWYKARLTDWLRRELSPRH